MTPEKIQEIAEKCRTPFYLYDMDLLCRTLEAASKAASVNPLFKVHYALKACTERPVLKEIRKAGFGLDTVSGGEIMLGEKQGFPGADILYAGVGKADWEIELALDGGIGCFNVESLAELEVISEIARRRQTTARVALRVNPEIDAHTHHYITTGLSENKFGINMSQLDHVVDCALRLPFIDLLGLHFHIGSQITVFEPFALLCDKVNAILKHLKSRGVRIRTVNVGGGLGIDYENPDVNPIPDFETYFNIFNNCLDTSDLLRVNFELGRSIVGQCGNLVTRVLYVKEGDTRTFAIVDAGMTELIRPALYGARHAIENVSGNLRGDAVRTVDIVGPVCESSDVFGKDYTIASPRRGDILVVKSAGAYGSVMSSNYNCRTINPPVFVYE